MSSSSASERDNMSESSNSPISFPIRDSPYSSPSQQVPQLTTDLTELTCSEKSFHFLSGQPQLHIIVQPQNHFRFRYVSEMVGTHGCLLGKSHPSTKNKTHPTVELVNYNGRALIRCQLAQCDVDDDHPHRLLEDDQDRDVSFDVPDNKSYQVGFPGMGIIHTAKKDVPGLLFKKFSEKLKGQNYNLKELRMECDNMAKKINLNIVRLKFSAHDTVTGKEICKPVFSEPIHNMKSAATNDLKICRISQCKGRPRGGEDIFMFVEKVNKKNIMIRFIELGENGEQVWTDTGSFMQSDVHHQYGIVFRTPPYRNPQTPVDVKVYIELVRQTDGRTSERKEFTYKAEQVYRQMKKRKTTSSYSSVDSSSGGSITSEIPTTVLYPNSNENGDTEPLFTIQPLPLPSGSPSHCGLGSALGTSINTVPSPLNTVSPNNTLTSPNHTLTSPNHTMTSPSHIINVRTSPNMMNSGTMTSNAMTPHSMTSQINPMSSQLNAMSSQVNPMSSPLNAMTTPLNEMTTPLNAMTTMNHPAPMWGGAAYSVPSIPNLRLHSSELDQLLSQDVEMTANDRKALMGADLSVYFNSFSSLSDLQTEESTPIADFIRASTDLVSDSGRVKVEPSSSKSPPSDSPEPEQDKTKEGLAYEAFYKPEDGMEVKKLVQELCLVIKNKKGYKNQEVRSKLERLFEIRLSNGDTFLHMTLCSKQPSFDSIVKIISSVNMSHLLNYTNHKQETILHLAVIYGNQRMIMLLVSKGCDPMLKTSDEDNVLQYAIRYNPEMLEYLLKAIEKYNVPCDFNSCNSEKQTALHLAALADCAASVHLLIEAGASYNVRDSAGRTPLHLAAYDAKLEALTALAEHIPSSDIDALDGGGNTALQIVCGRPLCPNTISMVRILLDKKPDRQINEEQKNESAWHYLCRHRPTLQACLQLAEAHEEDIKSEPEDDFESADEDMPDAVGLQELSLYIREVSDRLDAAGAWRELAKRLRTDTLTNWFATQPSPTQTLLNHIKECREDVTSRSLALMLEDIGQVEAANIIRGYLD